MRCVSLFDRLLLWLFGVARNLFLFQGLAFGCAAAASLAWTGTSVPPWGLRALALGATLSGAFVIAALLLSYMRSWTPGREPSLDPAGRWPAAFAGSLVLIAGLTLVASAGLPALWREIGTHLSAIGFWEGLKQPGQFGGIIIVPILVALFVPALVTATAAFSCLFALVLLARLPSRPLMFPTITSMGAVVQTALVVTGSLATAALRELSRAAATEMSNARDQEVRQLADQLTAAVTTLMTSAALLVLPAAVLVAWSVFLRPSGRAAAQFGRDVRSTPEEPPTFEEPRTLEEPRTFEGPRTYEEPPRRADRATPSSRILPAGIGGLILVGLGVLMLLFAGMDRLRARPAFVAATPEPGVQVAAAPAAIRVTFNRALHPASTLSIVYIPVVPSFDDISRDVPAVSQLSPGSGDRRTLEAIPPALARGLYLVRWVAYPEFGGITRHGSYTFGVGVPVPPDKSGMQYSLNERDSGERGRRSTMLGGVLLLVIGGLIWLKENQ